MSPSAGRHFEAVSPFSQRDARPQDGETQTPRLVLTMSWRPNRAVRHGAEGASTIGCSSEVLLLIALMHHIFSPYKRLRFLSSPLSVVLEHSRCCVLLQLEQFQMPRGALCCDLHALPCKRFAWQCSYMECNNCISTCESCVSLYDLLRCLYISHAALRCIHTPRPNSLCLSSTLAALIISTFHFVTCCHNDCFWCVMDGSYVYVSVCV